MNRDRIAMIISSGLVGWGLFAIVGAAWRNRSLTEGGAEILLAIAGALGASLTAYFVTKPDKKDGEDK